MKEGGTSLSKAFREYNLVFKGLTVPPDLVMADKKGGCIVCARWFLHYLCGEQFCLKIVIEYQFAKII